MAFSDPHLLEECEICGYESPGMLLYCNTCAKMLCKKCTGEHLYSNPLTKHDIVHLECKEHMPNVINCVRHQFFNCELFCKQCKTAVCSKCISSRCHRKHAMTELSSVFHSKVKEIDKDLENLEKYIVAEYKAIKTQLINMSKMVPGKYKNIKDEIRQQEERWIQTIKNDAEELLFKVDQIEAEHTKLFDHEVQKFDKCLEKSILENQKLTELRKSQNSNLILSYQSNIENLRLVPGRRMRSYPKYISGSLNGFGKLTAIEDKTMHSYQMF